MTDTTKVSGGVPNRAAAIVTADQVTILGNGTTEDPLRVPAAPPPPIGVATTIQIHGAAFQVSKAITSWAYSRGNGATGGVDVADAAGSEAVCPLSLQIGTVIRAIRIFCLDSPGSPATEIQASLRTLSGTAGHSTLASSQVSDGSGTQQTLLIPSTETVVTSGLGYLILVETTQGSGIWSVHLVELDCVLPLVAP